MAILDKYGNPYQSNAKKADLFSVKGFGGSSPFSTVFSEDYNPALRGKKALQAAAKMERTEAMVRSVKLVVSLPGRSTQWFVEEPDGAGAPEKEAAERLRANLFGGMETSFDELLCEGYDSTYFGFTVPEIEWQQSSDGYITIKRIEGRNPENIERWLRDEDGRVVGYLYYGNKPTGKGLEVNSYDIPQYVRVAVPLKDKSIHFVYQPRYGSPSGFGIWRSQYPHWYYLQALYKIMGIGIERNLLGVPTITLQEGTSATDKTESLKILEWMRAGESAGVVLNAGQLMEWFATDKNGMDAMPFLHHHKTMIAQVALAQFMSLGQQGVGTQALSDTLGEFFIMAEEAEANRIEGTLQRQVAEPWTRINYGDKVKAPRIRHRPIAEMKNILAVTQSLSLLIAGKMITPTVDDEEFVRDKFQWPEIPKAQLQTLREKAAAAALPPPSNEPPPTVDPAKQQQGENNGKGD